MIDDLEQDDRYLMLLIAPDDLEEVQRELVDPLDAAGVRAFIPPQGGATLLDAIEGFIGTAAAAIFVAERVIAWVHAARGRTHLPRLRLKRPGKPELDAMAASDEQIRDYITSDREQSEPTNS